MTYYAAYYILISTCLVLALWRVRRGSPYHGSLAILFTLTLLVEFAADWLIARRQEFVWLYHLYSPAEYALLSIFMIRGMLPTNFARVIRITVPLFALVSLSISTFYYHFADMPGINIGIESALLFTQATARLFKLHVIATKPILQQEYFWISVGLLLFFGVCSFLLGVYSPLFARNPAEALNLFGLIVKPFNLVLYGCVATGLWLGIWK